jgi:SAM-dependent methyltransferase
MTIRPDLDPFAGSEAYLESAAQVDPEARAAEGDLYLRRIERVHALPEGARVLEVGIGTGWFLVHATRRGFRCDGAEVNPVNVRHAEALLEENGVEATIHLGSIEELELPAGAYDAVVAMSVFEHVRDYRRGLENIHRALRPGGVLYFYSTNKFSPISGEYPMPLYGWWPNRVRYWFRVRRSGPAIITSSGVDFNQFTYRGLRRTFREVGFTRIVDQYEMLSVGDLGVPSRFKRRLVAAADRVPGFAGLLRTFAPGTCFICEK